MSPHRWRLKHLIFGMPYKGLLLLFTGSLIYLTGLAQPAAKFSISGSVKDTKTGEELIGASVYVKELSGAGAVTNAYGFYSLTLPTGNYTLVAHYLGYDDFTAKLDSAANQTLNIALAPSTVQLNQVEVTAAKEDGNVKRAQVSAVTLDVKEMNKVPVLFGERDILKTIQLLPGVMPASEGNSGFYVRGGSNDQNLLLLDEAPVYNASHMLGFFSTFNSDALKDATLYKGNMPAEYGGRISSVLDLKMKEGNDKNYVISGGIGLITSRLNIEGPIVKEKGSFFISGRTTYADLFLKMSKKQNLRESTLHFYDLNAKANYRFGKKDRVFISGYFGQDIFGLGSRFGIKYGNSTATLRWNHIFNDKLFLNTAFIFNNFNYSINIGSGFELKVKSVVQDYSLKQDLDYFLNTNNKLKFGWQSTFHSIVPGQVTSNDTSRLNSFSLTKNYSWENGLYAQHEVTLWKKVNINYGIRLSTFTITGPSNYFVFHPDERVDTFRLTTGQFGKTYFNAEPRFSMSYNFYKDMSLKIAYSRNAQNLHQLSNATTSNPTDRWIMSSNNVKPQICDQVGGGYFLNFYKNMFEFSVEGYFKWMQNQIDYKNGAVLRANETVESQLIYGTGRAYGLEVFLKKRTGKFTGWISYTLSRSERKFSAVNYNSWFPSKYDRTHDLSVVLMYDITPRINVSATFVYYTGNAVTYPSGKYTVNGNVYPYYGPRNQDRMPDYHRMDLGATFILKKRKNWEHDLNLSIYNLYARKNAYSIDFETRDLENNVTVATKTYLFRIVPSISYNFKFTAIKKQKTN